MQVYRTALKSMVYDESLPAALRYVLSVKLNSLPLNTTRGRVRVRCIVNRRPRGVTRFFRMNRIDLKLRMMRGQVAGMSQATWNSYGRQLTRGRLLPH